MFLLLVTIAVSLGGIYGANVYLRESANWRVQAQGQDWIDLCFWLPILAISVFFSERGRKLAVFIQGGVLVFFAYTYCLYAFAVHFNSFFLLYCAGLGFSVYGLLAWFSENASVAPTWFNTKRSTAFPWIVLFVVGILFYFLWLSEDVPAMWKGYVPPSLSDGNFFTNPVHVLDLSLLLPGYLFAALQFRKKSSMGYLLLPAMICASICMGFNVAFLAWYMALKHTASSGPVPYVFVGLVLLMAGALAHVMKGAKTKYTKEPGSF
jgi:hypothetical protein